MRISNLHKDPKSLAFVTTDKCTASCHNCCFNCKPANNNRLSLKSIIKIIEQVVIDFSSVKSCIFTGGECTLLKDDLAEAIEFAYKKNLLCRIVTNGCWAKSEEIAYSYLCNLHKRGLREINLSTGDEHQKWVPFKNILNACKAAIKLNILVAVNVESTPNSHFCSRDFLIDQDIKKAIFKGKIILQDSLWIEFDKTNEYKQPSDSYNQGCSYLFNTISISPNMHLLACCGLTCLESKILDLGDLNKYSIKRLWNEQFDDLVKLWLYTHGAHNIHNYLCKQQGIPTIHEHYPHPCSMCQHILNEPKNMEIIKSNIKGILSSVLLKFNV